MEGSNFSCGGDGKDVSADCDCGGSDVCCAAAAAASKEKMSPCGEKASCRGRLRGAIWWNARSDRDNRGSCGRMLPFVAVVVEVLDENVLEEEREEEAVVIVVEFEDAILDDALPVGPLCPGWWRRVVVVAAIASSKQGWSLSLGLSLCVFCGTKCRAVPATHRGRMLLCGG